MHIAEAKADVIYFPTRVSGERSLLHAAKALASSEKVGEEKEVDASAVPVQQEWSQEEENPSQRIFNHVKSSQ
jgi:hypothetical protein